MHAYMTRSIQTATIYNINDKQVHKKPDRKTDLWDRKPWLGEMKKLQSVGRIDDNNRKRLLVVESGEGSPSTCRGSEKAGKET